jgi:hypothetical protein
VSSDPADLDEVRQRACEFLREDEWELTETVERAGYSLRYNQCQIAELLCARLESGFEFHEVPLGEPPGSSGVGYVLNNVDGRGLHIKFVLEWTYVRIISFHISKHHRSD